MISTMIENSAIAYNHYEKDWDNLITQQNQRFLNAMADFEDEILTLLDNQISPIVIKLSLFYQWARLISWTHNLEDTQQTEWLAEIEQLMLPVGKIIRNKITSLDTRCLTKDSTVILVFLSFLLGTTFSLLRCLRNNVLDNILRSV